MKQLQVKLVMLSGYKSLISPMNTFCGTTAGPSKEQNGPFFASCLCWTDAGSKFDNMTEIFCLLFYKMGVNGANLPMFSTVDGP